MMVACIFLRERRLGAGRRAFALEGVVMYVQATQRAGSVGWFLRCRLGVCI